MSALVLTSSLLSVPGIGPSTYLRLEKNNMITVADLLKFYPRSYRDYSRRCTIENIIQEGDCTLCATVVSFKNQYVRGNMTIQRARIEDSTGNFELVWFNQPYLKNVLTIDEELFFAGRIKRQGRRASFQVIEYEKKTPRALHTCGIIPYYSSMLGMSARVLRTKFAYIFDHLDISSYPEYLPISVPDTRALAAPYEALLGLHRPSSFLQLQKAQERLIFEQLFNIKINQETIRNNMREKKSAPFQVKPYAHKIASFIKNLPFTLTKAQDRSLHEIFIDVAKPFPMNRMLLGDVGSGKTVIIALALYLSFLNGKKSIFLVPTTVLRDQHFNTLKTLLRQTGVAIALWERGSVPTEFDICVTTHAVLYSKTKLPDVGIIVIDEQHKFGVEQRNTLIERAQFPHHTPHLLTVSATPIPRSLALVLYGALELSFIDEMPGGRKIIKTRLVPTTARNKAYDWVRHHIQDNKAQVFVVCPRIDENNEEIQQAKSVMAEVKRLEKIFPQFSIVPYHSKSKDKEVIIKKFIAGSIDILVATTVIEVGIDIKNATIMVIENAERFGLAQLHQLRGRVGRDNKQGYCLLFTDLTDIDALKRLTSLEKIHNGFDLAEIDLKLRGPGSLLGSEQHGFSMDNLLVKNLFDSSLIQDVSTAAQTALAKDPHFTYTSLLVVPYHNIKQVSFH